MLQLSSVSEGNDTAYFRPAIPFYETPSCAVYLLVLLVLVSHPVWLAALMPSFAYMELQCSAMCVHTYEVLRTHGMAREQCRRVAPKAPQKARSLRRRSAVCQPACWNRGGAAVSWSSRLVRAP